MTKQDVYEEITAKMVAALKRDSVPSKFDTYPGQHFIIVVHPGTTEITDTGEASA